MSRVHSVDHETWALGTAVVCLGRAVACLQLLLCVLGTLQLCACNCYCVLGTSVLLCALATAVLTALMRRQVAENFLKGGFAAVCSVCRRLDNRASSKLPIS